MSVAKGGRRQAAATCDRSLPGSRAERPASPGPSQTKYSDLGLRFELQAALFTIDAVVVLHRPLEAAAESCRASGKLDGEVAIVGVTDERDLDAARDAADQTGVTYPLLADEGQTLLVDLEVSGLPGTVFVDADGTVVDRHLGALSADQLRDKIEDLYDITT